MALERPGALVHVAAFEVGTREHDICSCSRRARAAGNMVGMDATEIQRQARNSVRKGSILDVDHGAGLCRVAVGESDDDGLQTNWIPWLTPAAGGTREWLPPTKGEQVVLLGPMGDFAQAVALRGIYSDTSCLISSGSGFKPLPGSIVTSSLRLRGIKVAPWPSVYATHTKDRIGSPSQPMRLPKKSAQRSCRSLTSHALSTCRRRGPCPPWPTKGSTLPANRLSVGCCERKAQNALSRARGRC